MKVIIAGTIHDPNNEIIILQLTPDDKKNIAHMEDRATLYAAFPEGSDHSSIKELLDYWKAELT